MEKVELNFKTRIKNEQYKMRKKPSIVNNYSENMKKINFNDVKDYVLSNGNAEIKFKNFLLKIKELFYEINVPHKTFQESMIIEIDGKTFVLFKHTKKSGNEWFHFSDIFKSKNLETFYSKLKNFLKEKIGNKVNEVFKKFKDIIFNELKDEIENLSKRTKKDLKTKIQIVDNTYRLQFFSILEVIFSPFKNGLTFNVNEDIYKKHKEKFLKIIKEIILSLEDYFITSTGSILITIRQRPEFMLT